MSWDPNLDLEHGVLRNRLGITDPHELSAAEAGFTAVRLAQLRQRPLTGAYDLAHLRAFHRAIFCDVYDWAGELRTVAIGKGAPFCPPHRLVSDAEILFAQLARGRYLRGLDRSTFLDALTWLLTGVNRLHPFREGNGRTQRAFLAQLADAAGHPIRWAAMDPAQNVAASRVAHLEGDTAPLRALLDPLVATG